MWLIAIVVALLVLARSGWDSAKTPGPIAYSEFQTYLHEGRIKEITLYGDTIRGTFVAPLPDGATGFVTTRVDPAFAKELEPYGVKVQAAPDADVLRDTVRWIGPTLIFFALWYFILKRFAGQAGGGLGGSLFGVGKAKARLYAEADTKVSFADVAGVDEAKEELAEIIGFLRDPKRYSRLGGRIPKGVLLVGPPGTGKTLLARAVAGEAGVAFLSITGSEFVEMFVGVGAARVRDLFDQARNIAPAIIFIDELDALGRARGGVSLGGGHDEKEQTLNQLLAEMDGFDPSPGLVVLAATNRPEILDPALLRAGRFDRQILVDRPDKAGRVQILGVHLHKVKLGTGIEPEAIAALTPGFTGADLANLVNEAALLATRRGAESITMDDFTRAVERIVAGLEKRNRLLNPDERRIVAYHEMGHALMALCKPGIERVHKISIIPRGIGALGYTIQRPTEDRYLMTRTELMHKMAVLLGGRAAEAIAIGDISTGAADDLAKATDIARSMVARYGMFGALGQVAYEDERPRFIELPAPISPRAYGDKTATQIDEAVRTLVEESFGIATATLREQRATLERGAAMLLEKETLVEAELLALCRTPTPIEAGPLVAA